MGDEKSEKNYVGGFGAVAGSLMRIPIQVKSAAVIHCWEK